MGARHGYALPDGPGGGCVSAYTPPSSTISRHKAIQADNAFISLVRKRCPECQCATTAKQLVQFSKCPTCVKVQRISALAAAREAV